jgi:hypothetical protein
LATESFALSTWRNLASPHPVFKLLQPHIYGVLAIDTIGRKEMFGSGGIVDKSLSLGGGGHVKFMEKCFKKVNDLHAKTNLQFSKLVLTNGFSTLKPRLHYAQFLVRHG